MNKQPPEPPKYVKLKHPNGSFQDRETGFCVTLDEVVKLPTSQGRRTREALTYGQLIYCNAQGEPDRREREADVMSNQPRYVKLKNPHGSFSDGETGLCVTLDEVVKLPTSQGRRTRVALTYGQLIYCNAQGEPDPTAPAPLRD